MLFRSEAYPPDPIGYSAGFWQAYVLNKNNSSSSTRLKNSPTEKPERVLKASLPLEIFSPNGLDIQAKAPILERL